MPFPKNQHWVPRFYLRHFSTPESCNSKDPQIWAFWKAADGGDPFLANIKNVCARKHLYSPMSADGRRLHDLEIRLAEVESVLAPIWPELANAYVDLNDPGLRGAVALFSAILHLRHPSYIQVMGDIREGLGRLLDRPIMVDSGADTPHHAFVRMVNDQAGHLADILVAKRWSIVTSEQPAFITSDHPVGKQHQSKTTFGFDTAGVIVTLPLGPNRLLVMDDRQDQPAGQYYPLAPAGPGPYNMIIWKNADMMLSPRHPDFVLREIVDAADKMGAEIA